MSTTRIYVPSSLTRLADTLRSKAVGRAPLSAHAVTQALRTAYPEGSEEEWEYAATSAAAQASLHLLGDQDPPRRVVLAVDAYALPRDDEDDPTLVAVAEDVTLEQVASVLLDSVDAEADVRAAREAWTRAEAGDPEAVHVVERCLDHQLGWFAVQELDDLV